MNKLLLTFGCSWTYGVGVGYESGMTKSQYKNTAWNLDLCNSLSFRGLLAQQFNYTNKNFSTGGSSNQKQFRRAKQYFTSEEFNFDKKTYDKIVVLWGITSLYRNELFSNSMNLLQNFFYSADENKFIKEYFKHSFNEENELRTLTLDIMFCDKFFQAYNIDVYWFDTFNHHDYIMYDPDIDLNDFEQNYIMCSGPDWPSFSDFYNNNFDNCSKEIYDEIHDTTKFHFTKCKKIVPQIKNFIDYSEDYRDLASMLAKKNGMTNPDKKYHTSQWQNDSKTIDYLKENELVNPISFHPTKTAHEQIAKYIETKIKL